MGEKSGVGWTDASHGFWYGCHKVSAGCKFCYAERDMKRYGRDFATVTRSKQFNKPLSWKEPLKIFVNPWSDFFIEEADPWRDEAWEIIKATPQHTYQILTKRPERIFKHLPADWGKGYPNVWLGVTGDTQKTTNDRVGLLAGIPAAVRFVSIEPMTEFIDFFDVDGGPEMDWLICGCESGPGARPMDIGWARTLCYQCEEMQIPFFLKQMMVDGKLTAEPYLDGRQWLEFPCV